MTGVRLLRLLAASLCFLAFPVIVGAQTISQPADAAGFSGTVASGQSFIATTSGFVVAIDVKGHDFGPSWISTLRMYNGAVGSGTVNVVGAPVLTQPGVTITAVASGGAWSHITLTTPFPVVAGSAYSFMIDRGAGTFHRAVLADAYPGGNMLVNYGQPLVPSNGDVAFQIYEAVAVADLQVSQVASSPAATVGSTISYAITFSNAGPSDATAVTVADDLAAAGLVLLSAQSSAGVLTTTSNSVSLAVGPLLSGASGTLTVVASVSAGAGSITHTVTISGAEPDLNPANNSSVHLASRLAAAPIAGVEAVPTLSEWALILLASLMAGVGAVRIRSMSRTGNYAVDGDESPRA